MVEGLSILIPIYHWNPSDFVQELYRQAKNLDINFEICVYDDCSQRVIELDFLDLKEVRFKKLNKNIGRSAIRNLLAKDAIYDKLLFLDGDSFPKSNLFLSTYLMTDLKSKTIKCGGTAYQDPDINETKSLRWYYGKMREELASNRKGFASNNFLVYRSDFLEIKFSESIKGYGHEDTLFGIEWLKSKGEIEICDAKLFHLGLESDEVFMAKTKEGAINLKKLYDKELITAQDNKLIAFHEKLKFKRLFDFLIYLGIPILTKLVKSRHNLKAFDVLKWYWFNQPIQ